MPDTEVVADHYTHGRLVDAIRAGVEGLGKSPDTVSVEDLGPVDERKAPAKCRTLKVGSKSVRQSTDYHHTMQGDRNDFRLIHRASGSQPELC